jgi:hypothetical protein
MIGLFGQHSGSVRSAFRDHSGNTQGTLREHSENTQGTLREQSASFELRRTDGSVSSLLDPPATHKCHLGGEIGAGRIHLFTLCLLADR